MATSIETFFSAWGMSDDAACASAIDNCLAASGRYADPKTDGILTGPAEVADHVGAFSANAPGWTASVVTTGETAGMIRATVAFGGKGPDGAEMVQHGQYFIRMDADGKIAEMIGFAGTGVPR